MLHVVGHHADDVLRVLGLLRTGLTHPASTITRPKTAALRAPSLVATASLAGVGAQKAAAAGVVRKRIPARPLRPPRPDFVLARFRADSSSGRLCLGRKWSFCPSIKGDATGGGLAGSAAGSAMADSAVGPTAGLAAKGWSPTRIAAVTSTPRLPTRGDGRAGVIGGPRISWAARAKAPPAGVIDGARPFTPVSWARSRLRLCRSRR